VKARLLHGRLLSEEEAYAPCKNETKILRPGKHWTEVLVRWCTESNTPNEVIVAVETNNPRVAKTVANRLVDLTWGDDLIYAEFKGGKLNRYIRAHFPPYALERVNPRDKSSWKYLKRRARIEYCARKHWNIEERWIKSKANEFECISLEEALDYCDAMLDYEHIKEYVNATKDVVRASRELGDDLLNYLVRSMIEDYRKKWEEIGFADKADRIIRRFEDP